MPNSCTCAITGCDIIAAPSGRTTCPGSGALSPSCFAIVSIRFGSLNCASVNGADGSSRASAPPASFALPLCSPLRSIQDAATHTRSSAQKQAAHHAGKTAHLAAALRVVRFTMRELSMCLVKNISGVGPRRQRPRCDSYICRLRSARALRANATGLPRVRSVQSRTLSPSLPLKRLRAASLQKFLPVLNKSRAGVADRGRDIITGVSFARKHGRTTPARSQSLSMYICHSVVKRRNLILSCRYSYQFLCRPQLRAS